MKPLFETRLSDLGAGDFVQIECTACRHDALIPAVGVLQGLRLPPLEPPGPTMNCDCAAGDAISAKAVVSNRWAGSDRV